MISPDRRTLRFNRAIAVSFIQERILIHVLTSGESILNLLVAGAMMGALVG